MGTKRTAAAGERRLDVNLVLGGKSVGVGGLGRWSVVIGANGKVDRSSLAAMVANAEAYVRGTRFCAECGGVEGVVILTSHETDAVCRNCASDRCPECLSLTKCDCAPAAPRSRRPDYL